MNTSVPLFSLGQVVATPGTLDLLTAHNLDLYTFLYRHVTGDWGDLDDRQPLPALATSLWGKLFADKVYLSQPLTELLLSQGLRLVTPICKNMPNRLLPLLDKLWLRKRVLIETINDQLKNIQQVDHSRHRSPTNFLLNLLAGLVSYCFQPKKPAISLHPKQSHQLLRFPLLVA